MKSLAIIAISLLAAVNAANVTFKVVAPDAKKQVQVQVDGKLVNLKAADPDVPYYTGTADLQGKNYKYIVDGKAENFDRSFDGGDATKNDYYSRKVTYATNIPKLPTALSDGAWDKAERNHPIWDDNYIPTIFVTGDQNDMNDLIENVPKTTYKTKVTFIGPDDVYKFEDVSLGLHRPGRKNNDAKQSWIWALPEDQFLGGRNWFKLRHMEEDPTQLREKLYADIAENIGTYVGSANMVRLFVNKEGMGTFNMLDDILKYSYINAMFYGDGYTSFTPNIESPLTADDIAPFSEALAKVDFKDDAQVQATAQYFDYDQFLRLMAMEFLTGSWDAYWIEQTNDGAYIDLDEKKLYYLAQDFDATFGVNLDDTIDPNHEFGKSTVDDWIKKFPKAWLIQKYLSNPTIKATFNQYVQEIHEKIFNYDTLSKVVEARHNFYAPDLQWDRSIKQRSPGNVFGWTFQQTKDNLYQGVSAPGGSGGGAAYGLLEWVKQRDEALGGNVKTSKKVEEATTASMLAAKEDYATSGALKTTAPKMLAGLAAAGAAAALL
ncbi:coth protein-domain-containing protein [Mycotypha africana]|uniref:coth protein-domain-containing protein n=1 Tax=Mycotypha africana TaxID=64632 RepID=UPI0023018723|nr:coth protein-domain-containing protein [Mycotypha africana]KAI8971916.1 coth protein-domain-containing protein [Mycotypha africana]